jgi:hypothetical protein
VFILIFISVGTSGKHSARLPDRLSAVIFERRASQGASGTFYAFTWRHGPYSSTDGQNFTRLTTQPTAGLAAGRGEPGPQRPNPTPHRRMPSSSYSLGDCGEDEARVSCRLPRPHRSLLPVGPKAQPAADSPRRQKTSPSVSSSARTDSASKGDPRLPLRRCSVALLRKSQLSVWPDS